ncbi:MAG: hypothetical protein RMK32_06425 [Anaerolineae bacterium]|nr:hypothetical protein [Thermoflexus sp.]MDW8065249.1 hypothetical protein [Anaerolineae bacterium]
MRKDLIDLWIQQHKHLMEGHRDFLLANRVVAVQEGQGFRLARDADQELLQLALEESIASTPELLDVELPSDNRIYRKIIGLERYRFLFNPRQALALGKLVGYVRERANLLSRSDAEFGAAVAVYLAFGLCRIADFNSILTSWNERQGTIRDTLGAYYKFRELKLDGVYAEAVVPYRTVEWVFEPDAVREIAGGICPVLKELAIRLQDVQGENIQVFMADVLELSHHFQDIADVINVDPPYFDVHRYSDFSEFCWPILQATLKDVLPILFDGRILFDWTPEVTTVPRHHELIGQMSKEEEFEDQLARALIEMRKVLKEDGLFVLWFSHKEMRAWKAVARALQRSGFTVVNVIPLVSEHPTRSVTGGGKAGIHRVLVLVARKAVSGLEVDRDALRERFLEQLRRARLFPHEQVSEAEENSLLAALHILFNPNQRG